MFSNINECLNWIESQQRKSTKSLKHMQDLCDFYGNPERGLKYIHVAGTNGKGSIVAYFRTILQKAGLRVGSFTSPYIECFNERISINGVFISNEAIIYYTNYIISKYDQLRAMEIEEPSFFALVTLICFLYFQDQQPDIIVMEVGIGGTLDCTNVITPILTVISNVSYDHMNVLGTTIEEIASNKLGIVKDNVPLVTIFNHQIDEMIKEVCNKKNAPLTIVNQQDIINPHIEIGLTTFGYQKYRNLELKMSGLYQAENACLVIEGCHRLTNHFKISQEHICHGLRETFWPGRLEIISRKPLIILDGAHNINGIERLHEFIINFKKTYQVNLIVAISSNKEKDKMIHKIETDVDKIFFTKFAYKRSDEALNLFELSQHPLKQLLEDWRDILPLITNSNKESMWVFCGSLYFVSEIRQQLKKL